MKNRHKIHRKIHRQPKSKFDWLKKINIFKYLSIVLIIAFIFSIPAVIKRIIKINKIECVSQYGECSKNIVDSVSYLVGDYKTVVNQTEKILSENNQIGSFLIQYKMPNSLKIQLNMKKEKYAIKSADNKYYLIDKTGLVIQDSNESNLPTLVNQAGSYKLGEYINDKDKFALQLIEKVSLINSIVLSTLENDMLIVRSNEGATILFPLEGDVDVLVGSMRLIFSRLNEGTEGIRMEDVREIDLRFKNPVLR